MPINFNIEKYTKNISTYIETGFFKGDFVQNAINCNFKNIYSCDINEEFLEEGRKKFSKEIEQKQIFLYNGKSIDFLKDTLNNLNERAVFFLDAHDLNYEGTEKEKWKEEDGCPVISELNLIKNHKIKDHVIIIDDLRMFTYQCSPGTWAYGKNISFDNIIDKIREINDEYKMILENGICDKDVIVAYIE